MSARALAPIAWLVALAGCGGSVVLAPDASSDAGPGSSVDASMDAQPPAGGWSWLGVPGAVCANGSPTGIGINPSPSGSHRVVVYLESGGACWDGATCLGIMPSAAHLSGYGAAAFAAEARLGSNPLFARDASNPLADANLVYVPYCTGDLHAGRRVASYAYNGRMVTLHHAGGENLALDLAAIQRVFPAADRVWLAGTSAGGLGALLAWDAVAAAFAPSRVDVIDDAGAPVAASPGLWSTWLGAWGVTAPSGCAGCADSPGAWFDHDMAQHPASRFALLSYTSDAILPIYFRLAPGTFSPELDAWAADADRTAGARYFFVGGTGHVVLVAPPPDGAMAWLGAMVSDDPAWASVR